MKLKNKKTGKTIEAVIVDHGAEWEIRNVYADEHTRTYNSLAELNEEWEDVPEEPFEKDFYIIFDGDVKHCIWYRERVAACPDDAHAYLGEYGREQIDNLKSVGLYFETREEAELAVRKLKAWKRLKDKGFRFTYWKKSCNTDGKIVFHLDELGPRLANFKDDLDLLFGGEE